jgi:hypothetical protein
VELRNKANSFTFIFLEKGFLLNLKSLSTSEEGNKERSPPGLLDVLLQKAAVKVVSRAVVDEGVVLLGGLFGLVTKHSVLPPEEEEKCKRPTFPEQYEKERKRERNKKPFLFH